MSRAPLPIGGHVEGALARAPLFILFHEEGSEQAHGGFAVGEDADDALAPAHLLVEPFHPVRCSQPATVRLGQCEDGGGIVEAGFQDGHYLPC
jgi:hypothetical protein